MRALCLHGHFYQPPREDPWLGVVEPEASAAPARDWNERVTAECYAPNAEARVFDAQGRLADIVDTYEWTSFDFGPTLLSWMAAKVPSLVATLRAADGTSRARTGFGNAWAQAYGHAILPLSTPDDVRTQVRWGRRDFEHRFGRAPEGMWLPEMAVDLTTLAALADAGIDLTMLAPHQARRVRPLGADDAAWTEVTARTLDTGRVYRCRVGGGRAVDLVFRDATLSDEVSFGALLGDGTRLAQRLRDATDAAGDEAIVVVAADGETFGHHHRFGEMALAFALQKLVRGGGVDLMGPAAFRSAHAATHEVEIHEQTSWSCPHGVERWRADCGCHIGGERGWTQAWRAPLRAAIDWLRGELAIVYARAADGVLRDPWGARDRYIECLLAPERREAFLAREAGTGLSAAGALRARRSLELARHALAMQTSCGWFFDDLAGVEPLIILRHAARALELAAALGTSLEGGFVERLEPARSNLAERENGADLYRHVVCSSAATPPRVAACGALMAVLGEKGDVPGYDLDLGHDPGGTTLAATARIRERVTGTSAEVAVVAELHPDGLPTCRAASYTFRVGDLFGVQRERLIARLEGAAQATARDAVTAARRTAGPLFDALVGAGTQPPSELARLLGWEEAATIVAGLGGDAAALAALVARVTALRDCGGVVFPGGWLAPRLTAALLARLEALPEAAPAAIALLELATVLGAPVDLGGAQVRLFQWWRTAAVPKPPPLALAALREQLKLAPEAS